MRPVGTHFLCVLAFGIACGSAVAQVTPEQQSAMRAHCRSDFMSKCSGVSPGGKEALTCLQKNVETLSPGCKTAVGATLPKPAPAAAAPVTAPTAPPAAKVATPLAPAPAAQPAPQPPAQPRPVTAAKPPAPTVERTARPKPAAVPASQTASAPPAPPPPPAAAPPPKPGPVDAAVMLRACKIDLVRYCGSAAIGDGRKLACLNENTPRLTGRCRTALKVTAPIR